MAIRHLQLLRNVGQFDNVTDGARLPFTKLTLLYAENGRGKTTLASLLRSASSGLPQLVKDRKRLGATHPPHVVISQDLGGPVVFQAGAWSTTMPNVVVFDDGFVAANVCSGIEVETIHRQNLHELILGAQGVTLNANLRGVVAQIEQHNQKLRSLEGAVPASVRAGYTVEAFCALQPGANLEQAIAGAERNLATARASEGIRQQASFVAPSLPSFDVLTLNLILGQTLPDLETSAAARVREHLNNLGAGGETWVGEGMERIQGASCGHDHPVCPFCEQDLSGSGLLKSYQAFFSESYSNLKKTIAQAANVVRTRHGGDAPAAFERAVATARQCWTYWNAFTEMPEIEVNTVEIARKWNGAREAVLEEFRLKAAAPLESMSLSPTTLDLIAAYGKAREPIVALAEALAAANSEIALTKERAAASNVAAAQHDLARLRTIETRFAEPLATACQSYLDERNAKVATEALRGEAREALDTYRQSIFPAYEGAINEYLRRFNAGFRVGAVGSINTRAGSSCTYQVVINDVPVNLAAAEGPSFRTTLSAGDRNTLALAFFFASLDQDSVLAQKIVVIDDPMTSLDEHRSLTTIQEIRRLQSRVEQVLVLSHSKAFLCALWEGCDVDERTAINIRRAGPGSTLAAWDINQDCITEHDRRHKLVSSYVTDSNPAIERQVAEALRPMLEAFMRVAYPATFSPGTLIGVWIGVCQQRLGTQREILNHADAAELRALLDYANNFHHNTNLAFATAVINDLELLNNCQRILAFIRRPLAALA